jgi:WhiB family redox-sensing transcriptional regulator
MSKEQALCIGEDPELFFPETGNVTKQIRLAKEICGLCPIVEKCLDNAILNDEEYGIWGGATVSERRTIRRDPAMKQIHLGILKRAAVARVQAKNKVK